MCSLRYCDVYHGASSFLLVDMDSRRRCVYLDVRTVDEARTEEKMGIPSKGVFTCKRIVAHRASKVTRFQVDLDNAESAWCRESEDGRLLTLCSCRVRSVFRTNLRLQSGYSQACGC